MKIRNFFSKLSPAHIASVGVLAFISAAFLAILIGISLDSWLLATAFFIFAAFFVASLGMSLGWLGIVIRRTLLAVRGNEKTNDKILHAAKKNDATISQIHSQVVSTRSVVNQAIGMRTGQPTARPVSEAKVDSPRGLPPSQQEIITTPTGSKSERFFTEVEKYIIDPENNAANVSLDKDGFHHTLPVGAHERISVTISIVGVSSGASPKAGLIWMKAIDRNGAQIQHAILPTKHAQLGSYKYLGSHKDETVRFNLELPEGTKELELGLKAWEADFRVQNLIKVQREKPNLTWLSRRTKKDIRVAVILDEFSFNSFKPEFYPIVVNPGNWKEKFEKYRPDLFFCESAWSGTDSEERPWKGKVYTSSNFSNENRNELFNILDYCKKNGIPTVFWNKEDPAHFDDKKHNFVDTAIRFDHVFTTDDNCVSRYKLEHGHGSVNVLPFAVQPRLFNPIARAARSRDVVFAGGWYENHRERSSDMKTMFDAVLASGRSLKIYDRFSESADPLHHFPEQYEHYTVPAIPHSQMSSVYKESEIGMTINTETRSRTMFARRVFELMACNTLVVSNYSRGVENFFGDSVIFLDRNPHALDVLESSEIDQIREKNLTKVLKEHTYEQRFEKILDVASISYRKTELSTSVTILVRSLGEASHAWAILRANSTQYHRKIITVSPNVDPLTATEILREYNHSGIVVVVGDLLLADEIASPELFDGSDSVIVLTHGASFPDGGTLERLKLHSSYVDFPVVVKAGKKKYDFDTISTLSVAAIKSGQFKGMLEAVSNNNLVAYII